MRAGAALSQMRGITTPLLIAAAAVIAAMPAGQARASGTGPAQAGPASVLAGTGVLNDVAAISRSNAWAVGHYGSIHNPRALIEHWNGKAWHRVQAGPVDGWLDGVTATSAHDVWVSGMSDMQAIILHFNGRTWRRFQPVGRTDFSVLTDVTALSARDAWAVGLAGNGSLILHWNGTRWQRVRRPSPGPGLHYLNSVSAVSAKNVWAVGGLGRPLILHWNGTVWHRVTSPAPASGANLEGVAAISARNAWITGETTRGTLVLHWNGSRWRKVASPAVGKGAGLIGLAAISARDIWAVGTTGGLTASASPSAFPVLSSGIADLPGAAMSHPVKPAAIRPEPVILHWNGRAWRRVAAPMPAHGGQLIGTFAGPRRMVWAVGCTRTFGDRLARPLVLRWRSAGK